MNTAGRKLNQSGKQQNKEEAREMKKFGFTAIVASGFAAAVLGLAGPASAGVDHQDWLNQIGQHVNVPQVDTSVHQSR
ncbi:hypothetical protein A5784_18490 [Mycobacterium sp. 852013-50091_SCH5140682]|nr:hypothetical protein A5784_18490 [Mycobacterium sp. 852013-50091_SCH5140682]